MDKTGVVTRNKARLVGKRYIQADRTYYEETCAHVAL